MDYESIIRTIKHILDDEIIIKDGLTLVYELDEKEHRELDEHLYVQLNNTPVGFEHQDVFDIELSGIVVKFMKKGKKIVIENLDD